MKSSRLIPVLLAGSAVVLLAAGAMLGVRFAHLHDRDDTAMTAGMQTGKTTATERQVLYYRNPMGLPDVSPAPKKDAMGMSYIAVYAGEQTAAGIVSIQTERLQTLGVTTSAVERRQLARTLHAAGVVTLSERKRYTIAPRFEGWIETLFANETGEPVAVGQTLFTYYSPQLVAAQEEYLLALESDRLSPASGARLADQAWQRLRNWGMSAADMESLRHNLKPMHTLSYRAPVAGFVIEKPAVAGMRFMPGEVLLQLADLDPVWVIADVFEQDLPLVHIGQMARIQFDKDPNETTSGRVGFIYPELNPDTRTARVRFELPNLDGRLQPGLFARVELAAPLGAEPRLAIEESAVIDSGTRQVALVSMGEGRFEPRPVKLGAKADGFVEVLSGLVEGEQVVTRANFLIDAESNLKAALQSLDAGKPLPPPPGGAHEGH